MAVDLDKIEVRQAIDQATRGNLANAAKVIGVDFVNVSAAKLCGAGRNAIEHLIGPIEVVNRAENEIELVPVFFYPGAPGRRSFRIVVELEPGADFYVRVRVAQFAELVEIDARVITIVIGKRDVGQAAFARAIDPRLEQRLGEGLDPMTLRMAVIIGKKFQAALR